MSSVQDDPGAENAFFGVGTKYYEQVKNHSKQAYSVMFCCSADGSMLPPMVVYKNKNGVMYESWGGGQKGDPTEGPDGAVYAASENGWFNMAKFNQWFQQERI